MSVSAYQDLAEIGRPAFANVYYSKWDGCANVYTYDSADLPAGSVSFNPPGIGVLGAATIRGTATGVNGGGAVLLIGKYFPHDDSI